MPWYREKGGLHMGRVEYGIGRYKGVGIGMGGKLEGEVFVVKGSEFHRW